MFPINSKKCLHKFKAVRVLTGRDLFSRLGERLPNDRGLISSRNPATRHDMADRYVLDGYSKLSETPDMTNIPPNTAPDATEQPDE